MPADEHADHLHQKRRGQQRRDHKTIEFTAIRFNVLALFVVARLRGFQMGAVACFFYRFDERVGRDVSRRRVYTRRLGGEIHIGGHPRQPVQHLLHACGAGSAGHAGDGEIDV